MLILKYNILIIVNTGKQPLPLRNCPEKLLSFHVQIFKQNIKDILRQILNGKHALTHLQPFTILDRRENNESQC